MANMKTLTINGQKFVVDDENAVQIPETAPAKGTVPTADGAGGVEWTKPSSSGGGTFYVTITDSEPDKTVDELLEAYNNGMTLVCLNKSGGASMVYNLYGVNTEDKQVVFFFVYAFDDEAITIATITFTEDGISTGTVSIEEKGGVGIASVEQTTTSTADDGNNVITVTLTDGTTSTFTVQNGSKGSTGEKGDTGPQGPAGADAEFPTGGTDGQVLTLVSGSPAWANASGGGAGVISHFIINTVQKTVTGAYSQYTIDRTMEEVLAAYNAGYSLELRVSGFEGVIVPISLPFLTAVTGTSNTFYFGADLGYYTETGSGFRAHIFEYDGVAYVEVRYITFTTLPTGGTAGQVLTIGSDGSPVWADPVATSAEGVEFG